MHGSVVCVLSFALARSPCCCVRFDRTCSDNRLAPELKPSGASCCIYQESLGLMLHLFLEEAQLPRCEDHETLMVLVVGDRASVGVGSSFCAGKRFKIRQQ